MDIQIDNQQTKLPVRARAIQRKARDILNALDCPDGELSIVLVDDVRIADLNQMYLQHSGPTNVISFPMREGDFSEINPQVLGDVVISMDTCAREAEEAGIALETRLDQLLIHGILHLLGYDHVHSESEARVMEAKSDELLARLEGLS
jgi:probable rRNA maturation factor